jgi:hypothetical protein
MQNKKYFTSLIKQKTEREFKFYEKQNKKRSTKNFNEKPNTEDNSEKRMESSR